jgi:hypothetical protein
MSQAAAATSTTITTMKDSGNPSGSGTGGGGGGGGSGGGGSTGAGQQAAVTNGSFKGILPRSYDGNRKGLTSFLSKWHIFWNTNRTHQTLTNPYDRCCFFFTFLNGPAIDNWVAQKSEEWCIKVEGDTNTGVLHTHLDTDKDLWSTLMHDINVSYTETHSTETAFREIRNLKQAKEEVEKYITDFAMLLSKSNWQTRDTGTLDAFKGGLLPGLLTAISKHRPYPVTLDEWYEAARDEELNWVELQYDVAQAKARRQERCFEDLVEAASRPRKQRRDVDTRPYDPMDVDITKTSHLSEADQKKLIQEGKCFGCKEKGHLYRDCPKCPKGKGKASAQRKQCKAQTGETSESTSADPPDDEDTESQPPAYLKEDLKIALACLSCEERDEVIEGTEIGEEDF